MMKYQLPLVLFDPECPLCLRFKQGLQYLDKNLNFVSARDDDVYSHFSELNRQECLEKVHLITLESTVLSGPEVVDYLVKTLPGVSKLSWLLDNEQGKKVKEYFYQKVEELRELSSKKDSDCDQCPRS
jgi:predicted DCC family thiol-disulfide oxidoreductase YuxK